MTSPAVLYDGWPLVYAPNSPAALHLDLLLAQHPKDLRIVVALPGDLPDWQQLHDAVRLHLDPTPNTTSGKLTWEQRKLVAIARKSKVDLIHLTHSHPPLLGNIPTLVSPVVYPLRTAPGEGISARLRRALGKGGMARASGVLWPADIPKPTAFPEVISLPPYLPPDYVPASNPTFPPSIAKQLPETYLLYHGSYDTESIRLLLGGWRWGAGSIGQLYPLVLAGVNPSDQEHVKSQIRISGLDSFCQILPIMPLNSLPALYQGSTAVFYPAPPALWGSSLRRALACGRPVVTIENPQTDALVGPAGYVLPADEMRQLGAALITVVVEETVAGKLGQLGRARAAPWQEVDFGKALRAAYTKLLGANKKHIAK